METQRGMEWWASILTLTFGTTRTPELALRAAHALPSRKFLGNNFCQSGHQCYRMRTEGLDHLKTLMALQGIEPGTSSLVAQVPQLIASGTGIFPLTFTSALDRGEWSAFRFNGFTPGIHCVGIWTRLRTGVDAF